MDDVQPLNLSHIWDGQSFLNDRNSSHEVEVLDGTATLKKVHDVIVMFIAGSAMLAIGCDVSANKIKAHLRLPKAAMLGLLCQFILMPFLGFIVIQIIKMDRLNAAGVMILCCAPGGGYSNLMSYLTNSDVTLSALLTTVSSIVSLGITPLNLWFYSNFLDKIDFLMPYETIVISLAVLQGILCVGMLIRYKFIKLADYITKGGVFVSVFMLACRQIIATIIKPNFYNELPWKVYVACVIIPIIGLSVPYLLAKAMKEEHKVARTLALETAIQSIGTAFTIVHVSFSKDVKWNVQQYISLYSDITCTGFLGLIVIYNAIMKLFSIINRTEKSMKIIKHASSCIANEHFQNVKYDNLTSTICKKEKEIEDQNVSSKCEKCNV